MGLKDKLTLSENQEGEAIIVVVSNATPTGKPRSLLLSRMRAIQERLNPYVIRPRRFLLASYDLNKLASTTAANNLDIKEGTTRHSFNDGYLSYEFHYRRGDDLNKVKVSAPTWNANTRVILEYYSSNGTYFVHVWRNSANSFRIFIERNGSSTSQSQNVSNGYLEAIYGERLIVERQHQNV